MGHTETASCSAFGRYAAQTSQEWMSVLRVAHYMRFESLRELAIQELYTVASPVEKIVCACEFGLNHWLKEAYTDICYRSSPLCIAEGVLLGLSTCLKIASAREAIRLSTAFIDSMHADSIIRKTFDLETEQIEATLAPAHSTAVTCCSEDKSLPVRSANHADLSPLVYGGKEAALQGMLQEGKMKDREEAQHAEGRREGEPHTSQQAQVDITKPGTCVSEVMSHRAKETKGPTHNHDITLAVAPPPSAETITGIPWNQMSSAQRRAFNKMLQKSRNSNETN
jgi:hypothetical protein